MPYLYPLISIYPFWLSIYGCLSMVVYLWLSIYTYLSRVSCLILYLSLSHSLKAISKRSVLFVSFLPSPWCLCERAYHGPLGYRLRRGLLHIFFSLSLSRCLTQTRAASSVGPTLPVAPTQSHSQPLHLITTTQFHSFATHCPLPTARGSAAPP